MAQTKILVNGREFLVACEDGQEPHLAELARLFDLQVSRVAEDVGALGEVRLFLMGGLIMADELLEMRARIGHLQGELAKAGSEQTKVELKAVSAIERAARRIETLASAEESQ